MAIFNSYVKLPEGKMTAGWCQQCAMDNMDGKPGWKSHIGVEPLSIFWWATFVGWGPAFWDTENGELYLIHHHELPVTGSNFELVWTGSLFILHPQTRRIMPVENTSYCN